MNLFHQDSKFCDHSSSLSSVLSRRKINVSSSFLLVERVTISSTSIVVLLCSFSVELIHSQSHVFQTTAAYIMMSLNLSCTDVNIFYSQLPECTIIDRQKTEKISSLNFKVLLYYFVNLTKYFYS